MKALPQKFVDGVFIPCPPSEATHVWLHTHGPFPDRQIPVMLHGKREGTGNWTWNGDTEKPTLRPSILTRGTADISDEDHRKIMAKEPFKPVKVVCHSWVTDGQMQFLADSTHEFAGQTLDLLEVEL